MVASKGKGTSLYYIIGVYFKCVLKPVILFDIKKMPLFFGSTTFFSRAKIVIFFCSLFGISITWGGGWGSLRHLNFDLLRFSDL